MLSWCEGPLNIIYVTDTLAPEKRRENRDGAWHTATELFGAINDAEEKRMHVLTLRPETKATFAKLLRWQLEGT